MAIFEFNYLQILIKQRMDKQKEKPLLRDEQVTHAHRVSEQFVYNPDFEKHIGKRTGNYFGRTNPKQNFDGFPRFSEYQSHRNTDSSSLARELQDKTSLSSVNNDLTTRPHEPHSEPTPFVARESPIIAPMDSNVSSRAPEVVLPGFGEFAISSIKRRSSSARPSEIKSYRDLLNQLQADQFKEFIFNEQEIEKISQSANKEKEEHDAAMRAREETAAKEMMKKKKKQIRVSFKDNPIEHRIPSNQQELSSRLNSNKVQKLKQQSKYQHLAEVRPDIESEGIKNKQIISNQTELRNRQKDPKISERNTELIGMDRHSPYQFDHEDDEYHVEAKQLTKQGREESTKSVGDSKKENKEKNKKKKREPRITDSVEYLRKQDGEYQQAEQKSRASDEKKKKKNRKPKKGKSKDQQKVQNHGRKVRVKSERKLFMERVSSEQAQRQSERYPKRTRVKPVQYWENQRVHYKDGIAIGIERTQTLNLKQLLQTSSNFEHLININLHTHQVQIEIMIPGKKSFVSEGVTDPYESLEVGIDEKFCRAEHKLYYEDGTRSEQMSSERKIQVMPYTYFQITNKSKFVIGLLIRLKAKSS